MSPENEMQDPNSVKEELIKKYPTKVARKRAKAIVANDPESPPEIQANVRTVPGIITMRGCTYAGCKGVVIGPTRDVLSITHGPIGCGFYSWLTRRNQTRPPSPDSPNYMTYCASTDMQEDQIIFGGEKKLKKAIEEAAAIFGPKAIAVQSTCPVGLIGDDVHQVAREMSEKTGVNVFGFSCEGYKGVSQSAGHHIANNGLFKHVIGLNDAASDNPFKVNLLGEYNIGGDAFVIEDLFDRIGVELISTMSGNSHYDGMCRSHTAELNMVMCHRSINYVAEMMEKKYGIPWIKVNFIGAEETAKSLRKIGEFFENDELKERIEKVIAEEMPAVDEAIAEVKPRCEGKTAMLFVGGSRAHHYQELFSEIGMRTLSAGYEFAHRDDYEGREVLPNIKVDADSRNIEELKVEPDPKLYRPRRSEEKMKEYEEKGLDPASYEGMMAQMEKDTLIIDDLSHYEMDRLLEIYKPDIYCAGIKEKYAVQKKGIPCKQLHSYDYSGPYAGFQGAINFFHEIDRMVNTDIWGLIEAPWEKAYDPTVEAELGIA